MEQEKYRKAALLSLINILYVVTLWFVIIQNILKNEFLLYFYYKCILTTLIAKYL